MSGRILGDYEVIKQIGQGALGTVFLAEHRFMKRQYMLKVLPEELASDRVFVQRFQEQVATLAALEHPNIVKIHNVSFAQGLYFLVSDCVVDEMGETTNLAQHLVARGGCLLEEEIYTILHQIAGAIDYAHSIKKSHCGLKLNNILVSSTKPMNVFLCDFGLSSVVGDAAMLTRTFRVVAETLGIGDAVCGSKLEQDNYPAPPIERPKLGSLHLSFLQSFAFLAPEQKNAFSSQTTDLGLNLKIDVYAFGVLAYYLLTRQFPEGYFQMPSEKGFGYCWNWDSLVRGCLHTIPQQRPGNLVNIVEQVRTGGIALPRESLDTKLQTRSVEDVSSVRTVSCPSASVSTVVAEKETTSQVTQVEGSLKPIIKDPQLHRPEPDLDPAVALQVDPTVKQYQPEREEVADIQPILVDMVVIKGGTFYRGSTDGNRDEMPRHEVSIPSFAIDVHPITNEQFVRFLEVMGGEKDRNHQDLIKLKDSRIKRSSGKLSVESGYAKHPVVGVTWYGAVEYANWVGKRLPTEAEWEIAAAGGTENVFYPTGKEIEKSQANFFSSDTTAVMSYAANGYGIYDMAGNVYEWCHDWYGYNYYETSMQEPDNPRGPIQGVYRVLRGGCWKSLKEDLRCSRRHRNNPGTTNGTYGFRCVADVR